MIIEKILKNKEILFYILSNAETNITTREVVDKYDKKALRKIKDIRATLRATNSI